MEVPLGGMASVSTPNRGWGLCVRYGLGLGVVVGLLERRDVLYRCHFYFGDREASRRAKRISGKRSGWIKADAS